MANLDYNVPSLIVHDIVRIFFNKVSYTFWSIAVAQPYWC